MSDEILELAKEIGRVNTALGSIAKLLESDKVALTDLQNKEAALEAQLKAARFTRRDKEIEVRRGQVQTKDLTTKLQNLRMRFEVAQAEANRRKALIEKAAQFDIDTGQAIWRIGLSNGKKAMSHQINGAKFLASVSRAICADKRGLGKSLTSIIACDMLKANRVLVVSPYDVVTNFFKEFVAWSPRPLLFKLSDMPRNVREVMLPSLREQNQVVVFTNYESLRDPGVIEHLKAIRFDTIIADEAHIMKESSSLSFKAMKKLVYDVNICPQCTDGREFGEPDDDTRICMKCGFIFDPKHVEDGSGTSVKNVIPMTGTPILNRPQEMFTLLHLVARELFHSENAFLHAYCVKDIRGRWVFTPGGEKELMQRIASFFLRRTPEMAGVEFPAQTETFYELELKESEYPEQYKFYKLLRDRAVLEVSEGKIVGVTDAIALLTRLRQAIVYPYGIAIKDPDTGEVVDRCTVTQSVKMDWTEEKIQEIMAEDPTNACIVFSQFKPGLKELARRLNNLGIRAVVMDGDTSKPMREQIKQDFDSKYTPIDSPQRRWDVVLANYKVGGTGLNLSRTNNTIILDEEWNPGMIDQAYGRNNRLDSVRPSYVHVPQVKATSDRKMRNIIMGKANMIQGFDTEVAKANEVEDMIRYILDPEDD